MIIMIITLILVYYLSLLLSKAPFISEQFIYIWQALSNQTVPYQALTKIMKRLQRLKSESNVCWSPHLIPKVCLPINQAHFHFHVNDDHHHHDHIDHHHRDHYQDKPGARKDEYG